MLHILGLLSKTPVDPEYNLLLLFPRIPATTSHGCVLLFESLAQKHPYSTICDSPLPTFDKKLPRRYSMLLDGLWLL